MLHLSLSALVLAPLIFADIAAASPAAISAIESVTLAGDNGNVFGVQRGSVKVVSHSPASIYASIIAKRKQHLDEVAEQEECLRLFDPVVCLKLYPVGRLDKDILPPPNLRKLSIDPAYVSISFKPTVKGTSGRLRVGKVQRLNCLNPVMPSGYWESIDALSQVLKIVPSSASKSDSYVAKLKSLLCVRIFPV